MVFPTFLYLLLFSQVQMLNCLVYSLDLFIIALHSTLVIYGAQFTLTYHFLKGAYIFKTLIHCFQCTLSLPPCQRKPYGFLMFSGYRERLPWLFIQLNLSLKL